VDARRASAASGAPLAVLLLSLATPLGAVVPDSPDVRGGVPPEVLARFEASLERLRRQSKIPGLSAAVVSDGRLVWARGFGQADTRRGIGATPETPYPLASVTKPFAAVVVLQLVEQGRLGLDDPVSDYGLDYESPEVVRVRHLLSHTSRGRPGTQFQYDSDRFADLGWVIKQASGRSFRQLLVERILKPLGMDDTAPTPVSLGDDVLSPFRIWLDPRNERVYRRCARPYALDRSFALVEGYDSILFSPASGLLSSVADLARFDVAFDEGRLLSAATRERMITPAVTPDGRQLPYGLGWFSQTWRGTRLVWHYGWNPPTASALYLKMPEERLSLVVLANTDALSRPFDLGRAGGLVLDSTAALDFYEAFVLEVRRGRHLPRIDWEGDEESVAAHLAGHPEPEKAEVLERELLSHRRLFQAVGRVDLAARLGAVHHRAFPSSPLVGEEGLPALGERLRPWPSIPLFDMRHVAAFAWFLLVLLWVLARWPLRMLRDAFRRRRGVIGPRRPEGGWVVAVAVLALLAGAVAYAAFLARFPGEGSLSWSGGTLLAKSLIVLAAASGVAGAAVAARTFVLWPRRRGTFLERLHHTAVASGILGGAWALLDLVGWL
jgi:CubicO group peptidase (beta-lactamase class C family)